jgi:hypothetical protein
MGSRESLIGISTSIHPTHRFPPPPKWLVQGLATIQDDAARLVMKRFDLENSSLPLSRLAPHMALREGTAGY